LGRAGASAGVPISGKSAIDVEQPPTGSASSSAPATHAILTRAIEIKSYFPFASETFDALMLISSTRAASPAYYLQTIKA
jgi:hypothetical protein